ncbi:hypothetical protein [Candidatus Ichthyocystis hellenicum]|uniref:hypothetical protein n=1 Tax=Candidatus Ichthyocystis hellenicum TaxID=1561003 RepID=UPI000B8572B3|nr:hypothetical protein [Candidatus Ichthyocystis hellenicum]
MFHTTGNGSHDGSDSFTESCGSEFCYFDMKDDQEIDSDVTLPFHEPERVSVSDEEENTNVMVTNNGTLQIRIPKREGCGITEEGTGGEELCTYTVVTGSRRKTCSSRYCMSIFIGGMCAAIWLILGAILGVYFLYKE